MLDILPSAVMSVLITCMVSSNNDGLLRTNSGCTIPVASTTVYAGLSNLTVIAVGL